MVRKTKSSCYDVWQLGTVYNDLPRWLEAIKESNPGIIVQYIVSPYMIEGAQDKSDYTLDRVFWSF